MTRDSGCIDLERTHLIVKTTVARYAKLLGRGGRPQSVRKRRPKLQLAQAAASTSCSCATVECASDGLIIVHTKPPPTVQIGIGRHWNGVGRNALSIFLRPFGCAVLHGRTYFLARVGRHQSTFAKMRRWHRPQRRNSQSRIFFRFYSCMLRPDRRALTVASLGRQVTLRLRVKAVSKCVLFASHSW